MKGHMEKDGFHPHTEYKKGTRKSRDQKAKTQGIKIRKGRFDDDEERNRFFVVKSKNVFGLSRKEVAKDAIETKNLGEAIKVLDEGKGNLIIDVKTGNVISKTLKKRDRKARDEEVIAGKNKGDIIFDSKIGKNTLNGIPIHKGQTSMKEKEQLKFLESDNRKLHQIAVETQNKIDWRNMNRELSEIEEKMNALDQKELDGKISSKRYLVLHDQLEKQFTFVRWTKFGDLR